MDVDGWEDATQAMDSVRTRARHNPQEDAGKVLELSALERFGADGAEWAAVAAESTRDIDTREGRAEHDAHGPDMDELARTSRWRRARADGGWLDITAGQMAAEYNLADDEEAEADDHDNPDYLIK